MRIIIFILFSISLQAQTTFLERGSLLGNSDFRGRVQAAMVAASSDILADTASATVLIHEFASSILLEPKSDYFTSMFAAAVLTNPVISNASTDNDLAFTVATQYNKLALAWLRQRYGQDYGKE